MGPHSQHIPKAAGYAVLSAVVYSALSLIVKLIGTQATTDQVLFARYLIGCLILLPWAVLRRKELYPVAEPFQLVKRSICSLLSVGCFFYTLRFLPLGNALVLYNTYPLFIPVIAWALHKIRTPHKMWIGIITGFLGVLMILRPDPESFHPQSVIGLASGVFAAVALIYVRFMTKTASTFQILFYTNFICLLATLALLPFAGGWPSFFLWDRFAFLGAAGIVYLYFNTLSLAKAPARLVAPIMYLTIALGLAADYFVWGLLPDGWSFLGIVCIIAGGVLTLVFGQKELKNFSGK